MTADRRIRVAATSAREIVVETRDTRFVPDRIEIDSGETVTLVIRNADADTDHDLQAMDLTIILASDEAGGDHEGAVDANSALAVHVAPGDDGSITFMAAEPGTYRIFCTVDDHEEKGMAGTIVVT